MGKRRLPDERLRVKERAAGWATFACPTHGFLAAAPRSSTVVCGHRDTATRKRCGKKAHTLD